jgi:hypothetical protein
MLAAAVMIGTLLSATPMTLAETAPRSTVASPVVYHLVAEKGGLRVVVVTWKPGQRDEWHSHPVMVVYWLPDCDARVYTPDGKSVDSKRTMG